MNKKIVLITGASSGIGKATAIKFAAQGCNLILCGRRKEKLEELKNLLSKQVQVELLVFDVRDHSAAEKAINSLSDKWNSINVLINNAGNAS